MPPKRSALIRRRRRRFASASDEVDVGNNSSVSESGSSSYSISSLSEESSGDDDSEGRTEGAAVNNGQSLQGEAARPPSQRQTVVDPASTSQIPQGQGRKSVAQVSIPTTPSAVSSQPRFNSSNGWDRFPDVVDKDGQVNQAKIASSKPRAIHYLDPRKIIALGDYDGRQSHDIHGRADSGDGHNRNGFRPQSMAIPRSGQRHESSPFMRSNRWSSRQDQIPNYSDIVTLLLQSPLYVKIPGDATSKIIKGYHRRQHSFSPVPRLAQRPVRIYLPDMKAKIVHPPAKGGNSVQTFETDKAAIQSADTTASTYSKVSQTRLPVSDTISNLERPWTSASSRSHKYIDIRLEEGQNFQQGGSLPDKMLPTTSVKGRQVTRQKIEVSSPQPRATTSDLALATTTTERDQEDCSSRIRSAACDGTGAGVESDTSQRQNQPPAFMSRDIRFSNQDTRQMSRIPYARRQFGTPRENVDYSSHRNVVVISDVPSKNDSKESENVPPAKKSENLASETAMNSALFEDDEPSAIPKVRLPPASVYSPAPTLEVTESKSPEMSVAIESEPAPPTVVTEHGATPMQPSPAPAPLPPHSAEPAEAQPVAVLPAVAMIPQEYRLTPEVMHQPRPTKFVSVADIEPPVPRHSPVDGQQQKYTYAQRPRGFSNGYRGPRQDNAHGPVQYYYPSQTQDSKGMMRNMVPRAYAQGGYVASIDGMSPVAYPPVVMPNGTILPVAAPSPQPVVANVPGSTIAQETNGMVYFYDPMQYYQYYTENTSTPPQVSPVVMPVVAPTAQPVDGGIYYYSHVPQSTAYYQH
ncbi:hypothetical protein V1517DRAFT_314287 [Lipomyces orientalis]|uniref:Uncharacterized protein n=1 Tax=Lipomyces orientalis TaxID=1233043 RepID=A0ACC3TXJ4_9ASCO